MSPTVGDVVALIPPNTRTTVRQIDNRVQVQIGDPARDEQVVVLVFTDPHSAERVDDAMFRAACLLAAKSNTAPVHGDPLGGQVAS